MEVIETVKAEPAEPVAEAPKPKRRARRTAAEMQAEKESKGISVVIDGTSYQGQADDIAMLINAMQKAA
jgi:phosphohistidine phosphatase SixA